MTCRSSHGGGGFSLRRGGKEQPDVITIPDSEEDDNAEDEETPAAFLSSNEIEVLGAGANKVKQNVRRRALKRRHTQQDGTEMSPTNGGAAASGASRSKSPKANNKENYRLKELLLTHLDFIKQQSEDIVKKDMKLRDLQKENEKLKQRLMQIEVTTPATSPSSSSADVYAARMVKDEMFVPPLQPTRKMSISKAVETDTSSSVTPLAECSDLCVVKKEDPQEMAEEKITVTEETVKIHKSNFLECSHPYFVLQGEDFVTQERLELQQILSHSEVPGWRENPLAAIYSMEGTENIEDDTLLKRHAKPELDEKRRKRWDSQRLREQRNVQRLRARYEQQVLSAKKSGKKAVEFLPSSLTNADSVAECLMHVEVTASLPVSAFGFQLPALEDSAFSLPWCSDGAHKKRK